MTKTVQQLTIDMTSLRQDLEGPTPDHVSSTPIDDHGIRLFFAASKNLQDALKAQDERRDDYSIYAAIIEKTSELNRLLFKLDPVDVHTLATNDVAAANKLVEAYETLDDRWRFALGLGEREETVSQ